ncbi:von Willebrand factor type A domain protein [Sulfurimonas gotlandica GD1]|uniref:von Willebrand factor type A domain protein n=1 Tax=Sulfurimonas gotlandica (strain DSM 19862 / JCM 16533 / GD1) TaxID=929558 RepID=B6BN42_SULGG|nr:VWA domain-containing protein [Sulfurimonas gotlandica]EDZ61465.1 von Willebrand factor, type A [Sulfurimonas gotlandica GD1]EHP30681.1 von Willebrand factor type A domain protein [Sulfurimonas gotlandica GD1]
MFDGLYFEFPRLVFIIFFFVACASLCKMKLPSIYFPHTGQFMNNSVSASKLLFFLKWLGIIMLILALMSPVKDEPYTLEPKDGYEIALILDASQSMKAQGFDVTNPQLTRFDVVKDIVSNFIKERQNDNIGLVVFGAYSFIASPLTYDENILNKIVSQLYIGMAGKYTALFTSLAQGVNLLKMSESKSKVGILLTDGFSTPEVDKIPFDVALDMAIKEKIKIYPIGIGMPHEYNIEVLRKIAEKTGGKAFGAASATELKEVYKEIDALEKSEIQAETFSYLSYYYVYPLFISLLSLMLYVYFRNKRGQA